MERIVTEEWIARQPPEARAIISALLAKIEELEAELRELRGQVKGKTPQNSSLPPSTQHPHAKPERKKRKSKKRRGGRPGHKKHERPLIPADQCDDMQPLKPTECRRCGEKLSGNDPEPLRHQVWELPPIKAHVTEYPLHRLPCPCCGETTCAQLPPGVPQGQSGPRLMAFTALLMAYYRQSKRRTAEVLSTLLGQPCCAALTVNILLSFAQFEREVISERTRDKIAATRRKGKWCGGPPILGYDIELDARGPRLVVNPVEAERVRTIFDLYLEHRALLKVVEELHRRGWHAKRWTTRKGHERGGAPFDKNRLHNLLTNVTYAGKLTYKDEVHPGEHPAIVTEDVFDRVQAQLRRNGRNGGAEVRDGYRPLLKSLLFCGPCGCAMTHTYTQRRGGRRYRYYVCLKAQKRGRATCPSKSLPAGEIERFVVEHIRGVGRDPRVVAETVRQVRGDIERALAELEAERQGLKREIATCERASRRLACPIDAKTGRCRHPEALADARERIRTAERRMTELGEACLELQKQLVDESTVVSALAAFDPVWASLTPAEQSRLLHLLVERVVYDGAESTVSVTFRPSGIKHLGKREEDAA